MLSTASTVAVVAGIGLPAAGALPLLTLLDARKLSGLCGMAGFTVLLSVEAHGVLVTPWLRQLDSDRHGGDREPMGAP